MLMITLPFFSHTTSFRKRQVEMVCKCKPEQDTCSTKEEKVLHKIYQKSSNNA